MKKYFVSKEDKQEGPFSLEELTEMKISRETMIWFNGLDKWMKANHIEELNHIFELIPPPIKKLAPPPILTPPPFIEVKNDFVQPIIKKNNKKIYYLLAGVLLAISISAVIINYNNDTKTKQNLSIVEDIKKPQIQEVSISPKQEEPEIEQSKQVFNKVNRNELEGNSIFTSSGGKVNVRSSPSEYSEVLYQLEVGEEVVYLNDKSSEIFTVQVNGMVYSSYWYHVQPMNNADAVGWVHGGFLNIPNDLK